MGKAYIIVMIAGLAILITIIALTSGGQSSQCVLTLAVGESNEQIDWLDQNAFQFASTSQALSGRSEGGGVQIDYRDRGKLRIVEQRFYGETGRAYARFYYADNGAVFAVTKLNLYYNVPIYVDADATVGGSEKKDFYLSRDGTVCRWFLNDVEQLVNEQTIDMIRGYLAGVL